MSSPALSPKKRISDSSLSPSGSSPTKKVYSHKFPKKRKRVTPQILPKQVKRLKAMPQKRALEEGEEDKTFSDISDAEMESGTGGLTLSVSLDNVSDTSFEGNSLSLVDKPVNDPLLHLLEDISNDIPTNENTPITNENDLKTSDDTNKAYIEPEEKKTDNGSKGTLQTKDSKDSVNLDNIATDIHTNFDEALQESNLNSIEIDRENDESLSEIEKSSNEKLLKFAKLKSCRIILTPLPAFTGKNSDTDSDSDAVSDKESNEHCKSKKHGFQTQDSYFNKTRKDRPKTLHSQKSHKPNIGEKSKNGHDSNSGSSRQKFSSKTPSSTHPLSKTLPSKPIQTQRSLNIESHALSNAPTDFVSQILKTSNILQPILPAEKGDGNESLKERNRLSSANRYKKSTSSNIKSFGNDNTKVDKESENKLGKANKNPQFFLDDEEIIDLAYDDTERLQDIPGVNEEQAKKIIDYRERKSINDFFDFSTR